MAGFYTSKPWVSLLQVLRNERVNSNGDLLCEYCGKPIVNPYDCIGHHKKELKDFPELGLEPSNIALVHHGCHNAIHSRFGNERRAVFLVYGSPCSGKTTWVKSVAGNEDIILDIDELWNAISVNGDVKPDRIKSVVFALRDCLLDCTKTRLGKWRNAYIIGGYPYLMDRKRLCDMLGAEPIYIECNKNTCLERAQEKPPNWVKYVEDWWGKFQPDHPPGS